MLLEVDKQLNGVPCRTLPTCLVMVSHLSNYGHRLGPTDGHEDLLLLDDEVLHLFGSEYIALRAC